MVNNRQRIFFTCILPEQLIAKHGLSFAACNFSFNLMSGGGFDKVYSTMPLFVGGEMDKQAFEDGRFELVYDKLRKKGGIWQKLAALKEQWTIFRKFPNGASVWFYNLNILSALLFLLLKVFKPSVQLNVIVLDYTPATSWKEQNHWYLKLINCAHGRICLSNSTLFNQVNSVTIPGVVPANNEVLPVVEKPELSFLLSGVLLPEISQLEMVLKAFAELPQCELHITGTKGNVQLLNEYASKYDNIHWYGQLPFKKYLELMYSVTFQLSTRNPEMPENLCNFPSKIIEALLHNRIIVSTIEYKQLVGIKYLKVISQQESFKQHIEGIAHMSEQSLLDYANQGKKVAEKFSTKVWNETMEMIENN